MNINEAKEFIKNDIEIYLSKDEYGDYRIPIQNQRPVFLLGAPGIGKTAIMEQIASELGIALVAYSMTHHTRQSALGLPFISHEEYEGMRYDVTLYTMSEIIASVYEVMRNSGIKEGILFLDEINCVSETLAPSMLQFLQYKVFGRHRVPDGWVIVTAGNPPEYNKNVREFDVVTMDRLKVLEVEADYETWKKYAKERGVHPAVTAFLEIHKDYFYHMEMTVKGRSYVTARGWEDLSKILILYEEKDKKVTDDLVQQYIRNERIVKEFSAYYDMYRKYKKDYRLDDILDGNPPESAIKRGARAGFDERLSVLGMLTDRIMAEFSDTLIKGDVLKSIMPVIKRVKEMADEKDGNELLQVLNRAGDAARGRVDKLAASNTLTEKDKKFARLTAAFYDSFKETDESDSGRVFEMVKASFDKNVNELKEESQQKKERLHNLFDYVEKAFGDGNELLILVTELTVNEQSSRFITSFGSEDYEKASDRLMLSERRLSIEKEIDRLML